MQPCGGLSSPRSTGRAAILGSGHSAYFAKYAESFCQSPAVSQFTSGQLRTFRLRKIYQRPWPENKTAERRCLLPKPEMLFSIPHELSIPLFVVPFWRLLDVRHSFLSRFRSVRVSRRAAAIRPDFRLFRRLHIKPDFRLFRHLHRREE
jgi:hypothetical protein